MHVDKHLFVFSIIFACASASHFLDQEWKTWKSKYGKNYMTLEDELLRREAWEATWDKVQKHNQLADQGLKTYRMAMNHFADMTLEEIKSRSCLLSTGKSSAPRKNATFYNNRKYNNIPQNVDWRDSKCVTPVKDQGSYCGSCWAFATVGVIESRHCIKNGELLALSEQQLVDCDKEDSGCCGGLPIYALDYIAHDGIMQEKDYEYTQQKSTCLYEADEALKLNVSKYYFLPEEENMAASVAIDGPITVGIAANIDFMFYSYGIFDEECNGNLNHAIIIIGYGTIEGNEDEEDNDYWIIKNSWGEYWGENGYGKMKRNVNMCGITGMAATMDFTV